MSNATTPLIEPLYDYFLANSLREAPILRRLREDTARLPMANMQISPEQGQFMAFLIELMAAKRTIEIGTFTGYSALCVALAMPSDGRVIACDVSAEWTSIGKRYWTEAGVADRIDLRLAPALETLDRLTAAGEKNFDFAFIDADKENNWTYFERLLGLLKPGGVIAVDNTLWAGHVADPRDHSKDTEAIRQFNAKIHKDQRVTMTLVPIGDGLTLARKRH